jgi:hypothetical protein
MTNKNIGSNCIIYTFFYYTNIKLILNIKLINKLEFKIYFKILHFLFFS